MAATGEIDTRPPSSGRPSRSPGSRNKTSGAPLRPSFGQWLRPKLWQSQAAMPAPSPADSRARSMRSASLNGSKPVRTTHVAEQCAAVFSQHLVVQRADVPPGLHRGRRLGASRRAPPQHPRSPRHPRRIPRLRDPSGRRHVDQPPERPAQPQQRRVRLRAGDDADTRPSPRASRPCRSRPRTPPARASRASAAAPRTAEILPAQPELLLASVANAWDRAGDCSNGRPHRR